MQTHNAGVEIAIGTAEELRAALEQFDVLPRPTEVDTLEKVDAERVQSRAELFSYLGLTPVAAVSVCGKRKRDLEDDGRKHSSPSKRVFLDMEVSSIADDVTSDPWMTSMPHFEPRSVETFEVLDSWLHSPATSAAPVISSVSPILDSSWSESPVTPAPPRDPVLASTLEGDDPELQVDISESNPSTPNDSNDSGDSDSGDESDAFEVSLDFPINMSHLYFMVADNDQDLESGVLLYDLGKIEE